MKTTLKLFGLFSPEVSELLTRVRQRSYMHTTTQEASLFLVGGSTSEILLFSSVTRTKKKRSSNETLVERT